MKIFITGGRGFVGSFLTELLLEKGHHVTVISRSGSMQADNHSERFSYISADTTIPGEWQNALREMDVVINLAGATIFHYWTRAYKEKIYNSRILTTRNLVDALPGDGRTTLISTSAAGFYGDRGDDVLTEDEPAGDDFLAQVCRDWEKEAFKAKEKNARIVITRFGIVADSRGGAMGIMMLPFKFFVGGPIGSGRQWFSWIHLKDLLSALSFCIENRDVEGVLNFTAPNPIRNRELSKAIGNKLHRPAFFKVPALAIRAFLGEFGSALICSQRAVPQELKRSGFSFQYQTFEEALEEIAD